MEDLSEYFRILGLKPGASPEEVKLAYRDLVKVWHPDRFSHDERLRLVAQNKLKEINGAYKVLQAHFFEADILPESAPQPEPESAAQESATVDPPSPRQGRVMWWTALGVFALAVLATGLFWNNQRSRVSVPVSAITPIPATVGASSYALSFNGNQSHVEIATTGSLSGTFTVECWAMSHRPKVGGVILSSRGPDDFGFDIRFRQGKRFHGDIGDGTRWLAKMANATFSYNGDIWYHVAYVVTPTNYTIYINGKRIEENSIYPPGNPLLYDAGHQLCLGTDKLDPVGLDGCVADVRIWQTARTAQQIKAGMNTVLTGDEPGLQACWRFGEGAGLQTTDITGRGFTGKLVGNVSWTTNTPDSAR